MLVHVSGNFSILWKPGKCLLTDFSVHLEKRWNISIYHLLAMVNTAFKNIIRVKTISYGFHDIFTYIFYILKIKLFPIEEIYSLCIILKLLSTFILIVSKFGFQLKHLGELLTLKQLYCIPIDNLPLALLSALSLINSTKSIQFAWMC